MTGPRALAGGLLAVLVMAAVVGLSWVPWVAAPGNDGELRLAWRWRSERVEQCRRLSEDELRQRPVHMRVALACERALRPYLLDVEADGRRIVLDSVRARGAESDRPLSVFRRLPLPAGRHAIRVSFRPLAVPGDSSEHDGRGDHEEHEGKEEAAPLELEVTTVLAPRQVVLVTLDDENRVLVLKTTAAAGGGAAPRPR